MSGVAAQAIIGGGKSENRKDADFYPTPPECTDALVRVEGARLKQLEPILEPACGNGAIAKRLLHFGISVIASDLHYRGFGVPNIDFLTASTIAEAVVTNPPFKLAQAFIERSASLNLQYVALILKSQFWHAKKRAELFRRYTPSVIYPMLWRPDFDDRGAPTMDCLWVVWDKKRPGPCRYELLDR